MEVFATAGEHILLEQSTCHLQLDLYGEPYRSFGFGSFLKDTLGNDRVE